MPGASFAVNGAVPVDDAALITASAELKRLNGLFDGRNRPNRPHSYCAWGCFQDFDSGSRHTAHSASELHELRELR
jgi:hypothetical protein